MGLAEVDAIRAATRVRITDTTGEVDVDLLSWVLGRKGKGKEGASTWEIARENRGLRVREGYRHEHEW